jgi:para-nitrobenzyl esterase
MANDLFNRREACGQLAAAISLLGIQPGLARAQGEPVVETSLGKVRGRQANGVYAFKGIRYAASTAGANRFMPPQPANPWGGVTDAFEFGASAPSSNPKPPPPGTPSRVILAQLPRPAGAPAHPRPKESEDCLFLNVWTAGLKDGRKRPVMFWLHGGFFASGSGSGVDGTNLAKRGDVVVVSVNHRLNVFGFTHLAEAGGKDFAHSGNAGMLDIVAALRWVHDNIAAFGGDPKRVMVFGESGGGMKTSFLLAAPAAKGLVHRAGVQSGPGLKMVERAQAARVTETLLSELQLDARRVRDLQKLPVEQLLTAYFAVKAKHPEPQFTDLNSFAPVVDGDVLPRHPFDPDAPSLSADVPLLIGWNLSEMTFFMGADAAGFSLDEGGLRERVPQFLGSRAQQGIELYKRRYPQATPSQLYIQMWSDFSIMTATLQQAERKAAQGRTPAFVYRFDWKTPVLDGKLGSTHTLENPFVWNDTASAASLVGGGAEAARLAARVSDAWVTFCIDGAPGSGPNGLPRWPAYDVKSRPTMIIDNQSRVLNDPTREERVFLET